jgi:hypothetical protein
MIQWILKDIKRLAAIFIALMPISIGAQVTTQTVKPFKSLCISDKETGFNWSNGGWVAVNFKSDKYILKKIDYDSASASNDPSERPLLCKPPEVLYEYKNITSVRACYSFSTFGRPTSAFDMQDCSEVFNNGRLERVDCKGIGRFKPNGLFIKLPSDTSMDLSDEKTKDSMVLAVGTCGVL